MEECHLPSNEVQESDSVTGQDAWRQGCQELGKSEGQATLCIPNSLAIGIDLHVFKTELPTCHMLISLQIGAGPGAPGCQPDLR